MRAAINIQAKTGLLIEISESDIDRSSHTEKQNICDFKLPRTFELQIILCTIKAIKTSNRAKLLMGSPKFQNRSVTTVNVHLLLFLNYFVVT